jgi:hypothetical protein
MKQEKQNKFVSVHESQTLNSKIKRKNERMQHRQAERIVKAKHCQNSVS